MFGGFAKPAAGSPGPDKSLYKGCKAKGQYSVTILLTRRSSSFIGALALTNFGMASPTALKKYQADAGTVDSNGVFHPTGTFGTQHPVGTGPFMLQSWRVGEALTLVRNPNYWGAKAKLDKVIVRPIADNAARLQALQSGEINGYDLVDPADINTIKSNKNLKILDRPAFNVGYVGINQKLAPMNNPLVRQAVAYGLDRSAVVKGFYAGRGVVADQFLPDQVVGFAKTGVPQYTYDPTKAKALLQQAGLTLPVAVDFWYPTSVSRPYMPDPKRNAEAFGASLEKAGFKVTFHSSPWRPDYLGSVQSGKAQLYLLGWTGDFGDPANFLNVHFGAENDQFGFNNPALFSLLQKADSETNLAKRATLYQQASIMVMKFLPMVPYVHSKPALGFQKKVNGYTPSPVSLEPFAHGKLGNVGPKQELGGRRDVAVRRPPAPAARPDPPRGLDPRLRMDQGAPRLAGPGTARRAGDAGDDRAGPPPVQARPTDLRAVLGLPPDTRSTPTSVSASASRRTVVSELERRFPATVELALSGDVRRNPLRASRSDSSPPSATAASSTTSA